MSTLQSTTGTVTTGLQASAGVEQLSPRDDESASSTSTRKGSTTEIEKAPAVKKPSPPTLSSRLSHACLNLPPAFFSINMGTGITSILLHNFPYPAEWLRIVGIVIFVLNIAIFCLLAAGNIARYVKYMGIFQSTYTHPMSGMFWGTLPMGLATIVVSQHPPIRSCSCY